jgi:hypothetical protein
VFSQATICFLLSSVNFLYIENPHYPQYDKVTHMLLPSRAKLEITHFNFPSLYGIVMSTVYLYVLLYINVIHM